MKSWLLTIGTVALLFSAAIVLWSLEEVRADCPQWTPYPPGWCAKGIAAPGDLDENGCRGPARCLQATPTPVPESYTACGCGCCGGAEPQTQCIYKAKGESLDTIKIQDQAARLNPQCSLMGCSLGTKYTYCDEPDISPGPTIVEMPQPEMGGRQITIAMQSGQTIRACGVSIRYEGTTRAPGTRSDWRHSFDILDDQGSVLDSRTAFGTEEHDIEIVNRTDWTFKIRVFIQKAEPYSARVTYHCGV